jgi:formate hydrogenlyase subunit 6/NADH:ubiquinone oxidoreductase subunit I
MKTRTRYPKIRELKEAFRSIFSKPYTTSFPKKPHKPFEGFRGKPEPDKDGCIACGACTFVCPSAAIELKENLEKIPPTREIIWRYDLCIFCGQCERICTTQKGVKLGPEFDLATADRTSLFSGVEKDLVLCEDCGTIVGTEEQLKWLLGKLGPLSSGNYNLIYSAQKELELAKDFSENTNLPGSPTEPRFTKRSPERSDLYRILCPKCRHVVLAYNQTGKKS